MVETVYDHIRVNKIKIWMLIFVYPLIFGIVFYVILNFFAGLFEKEPYIVYAMEWTSVIFFILCFIWVMFSYWAGDYKTLNRVRARSFDEIMGDKKISADQKERILRVQRIIKQVALRGGLKTPAAYLIHDDSMNVFTIGQNVDSASMVFSSGLIEKLSVLELEAVIAHEMAHIGNGDICLHLMLTGGIRFSAGIYSALVIFLFVFLNLFRKSEFAMLIFVALLPVMIGLPIFYKLFDPISRLAVSKSSEFRADATGALITRDPASLAAALEKIKKDPRIEALDAYPEIGGICICDPRLAYSGQSNKNHPSVGERIKRLYDMARQKRFQ